MRSLTDIKTLEKTVYQLLARSWMDVEFQKRFFSEPAAMLREAGLEEFVQVEVMEKLSQPVLRLAGAGGTVMEIPLPAKPAALADEQLLASIGNDTIPFCFTGCSCS
ncbi:MAG: hypothetical protein EBE86_015645 [Hormoscilla sp. GUM202]|nr:hypothetical protein [Hormoscilla sp. GUM202]